MSKLSKLIGKKFIYTAEIMPPKGPDMKSFKKAEEEMKNYSDKITAVNIPDTPSAMLLMNSLVCSIYLKQNGLEPIYQVSCRDRNSLAIGADLLAASAYDIENVFVCTGDHPLTGTGDHRGVKAVYELDSTSLIKMLTLMNQGSDIAGNPLNRKTEFYIGSDISLIAKPMESEIYKTNKKLSMGAGFLQTRIVFDLSRIEVFLSKYETLLGEDIRNSIVASLYTISDFEQIKHLKNIPNLIFPRDIGKRIKDARDPLEEGVQITLERIDKAKELGIAGVNLYSGGSMKSIREVIKLI